jgi:hypothetical protein
MRSLILITVLLTGLTGISYGQGMTIDSLESRLSSTFSPQLFKSLRDAITIRYDDQRVWGLATGDFSSDGRPDLAISLFDLAVPNNREVTVYLLVNEGHRFAKMFTKKYPYLATPIEVGLAVDGYVVTVVNKSSDQHWSQEGFTIYAGDVIQLEKLNTQATDFLLGGKPKSIGNEYYQNFESLFTSEKFFDFKNSQQILASKFYTFPAYSRMRSIYPGYGRDMYDTTTKFVIKGDIYRTNDKDLSIDKGLAAYDDEFIYISLTVHDDQVWGGNQKLEANDRISLWFDSWTGQNRYFVKSAKGSVPLYRTKTDSSIYNIIFALPEVTSKNPRITASSAAMLSDEQEEASKQIRGLVTYDTLDGKVIGYTLKARVPFMFLGFETNPVGSYEERATEGMFDESKQKAASTTAKDDFPRMGFTAVVQDIDNPALPDEVTQQATSDFRPDDPTSYGELVLVPTGKFYGSVQPTYLKTLTEELLRVGY